MKRTAWASCLAVTLGVIGCGGGGGGGGGVDEGPKATPGKVNPTAAAQSAKGGDTMLAAVKAGSGEAMTGAAFSLGGGPANTAVTAALTVSPEAGILSPGETNILRPEQAVAAAKRHLAAGQQCTTGTSTCSTTGCVFDKCAIGQGLGGANDFVLNGSITASPAGEATHVVWNLDLSGTSTQEGLKITIKLAYSGDLTVSPTLATGKAGGTWHITSSGTVNGVSFSSAGEFGAVYKFNDIVMCKGSPNGGSIYIKVWQTVSGAGASSASNKAYEGTHTFTPGTCA